MADPYVPGLAVARSVYDQGIAPLAEKVQGFLKGTAGLPGAVKDYAVEAGQSEAGPTTKVIADLLTLGQGMREGIRENPLRAMAEMNPLVGGASDLFETNQLLDLAQNAEESGDLEKAQTLRELANTIVLMGMVPGGPPAKRTIEQKLKEMAENRRKLKEETGLPYVPNKNPPPPEGRRIDVNDPDLDRIERQRRLEQARREPSPTPQEPSPTVQESLLSDVRFSTDQNAPGMTFETWNMINDPEHFIKSRGKITDIEQMSPGEYISRVSRDVFPTFGEAAIRQQRERTGKIPSIMQAMEEGTEFGLPMIHYDQGRSRFPTQEGLHRAMAAERLGIPEIPVAIHQLDRSPAARAARAEEFGFDTDVYHGTLNDFSEFDPSEVDIGVHVGSSEQATNRLLDISEGSNLQSLGTVGQGIGRLKGRFDQGSQVMPLKARMTNTLELSDVGEWKNSFNVIDELIENPQFEHKLPELRELRKWAEEEGPAWRDEYGDSTWDTSPQNREALDELNRMIRNEGFDSIKYLNRHENNLMRSQGDPYSYIILDPKDLRSVNADFNPQRMNEADLQAGIASLGATEGMA